MSFQGHIAFCLVAVVVGCGGSARDDVPLMNATDALALPRPEAARRVEDPARVVEIDGAGHFELVNPVHAAFSVTRDAVMRTLDFGNQP